MTLSKKFCTEALNPYSCMNKHSLNSTALVWHEALIGHKKENIHIYKFVILNTLYHGWTSLKTLDVKYFEPGHTFLVADSQS